MASSPFRNLYFSVYFLHPASPACIPAGDRDRRVVADDRPVAAGDRTRALAVQCSVVQRVDRFVKMNAQKGRLLSLIFRFVHNNLKHCNQYGSQ